MLWKGKKSKGLQKGSVDFIQGEQNASMFTHETLEKIIEREVWMIPSISESFQNLYKIC